MVKAQCMDSKLPRAGREAADGGNEADFFWCCSRGVMVVVVLVVFVVRLWCMA